MSSAGVTVPSPSPHLSMSLYRVRKNSGIASGSRKPSALLLASSTTVKPSFSQSYWQMNVLESAAGLRIRPLIALPPSCTAISSHTSPFLSLAVFSASSGNTCSSCRLGPDSGAGAAASASSSTLRGLSTLPAARWTNLRPSFKPASFFRKVCNFSSLENTSTWT
ncbi:hypothetical protein D3C78_1323770 [compost metagenome]